MKENYHNAVKFIVESEGGLDDDPVDRGGRTAYGITQGTYNVYRMRNNLGPKDVWEISPGEVEAIYHGMYWVPAKCDLIPVPLDTLVFDSAIQHGVARSLKWVQMCVGASPDGLFGQKSKSALLSAVEIDGVYAISKKFMSLRDAFYSSIVHNDPTQKRFEKGWKNRMLALRKAAGLRD